MDCANPENVGFKLPAGTHLDHCKRCADVGLALLKDAALSWKPFLYGWKR